MASRSELLRELNDNWRHCLRCKLADKRLEREDTRGKMPAAVPLLSTGTDLDTRDPKALRRSCLHVLLPCPDPEQHAAGNLAGADTADEYLSRSISLLKGTWDALEQDLPFPFAEVTLSTGLGCRPVNFADPRKLMKPKPEWTKSCRGKLATEITIVDPDLVMVCGTHALASVAPKIRGKFTTLLGEVISFTLPGRLATRDGSFPEVEYFGYVAPSPEEIDLMSRDDHLDLGDWGFVPIASHVHQPFHYFCWHVVFSAWLAQTLRDLRIQGSIDENTSMWPFLQEQYAKYFEERDSVQDLVTRVKSEISAERDGPGALAYQQGHATLPSDEPLETSDDDDDAEEVDDSDS